MAPAPTATNLPTEVDSKPKNSLPREKPTRILHRTPWTPPIAVSGQGIYLTLENGQTVIDGCGGAAVSCIGMGHPAPLKALKDQVDKLACELFSLQCIYILIHFEDVYNMQLSNEPAEELAKLLCDSSNGAFDLVGFASGGSEAMEGVIKLARQVMCSR